MCVGLSLTQALDHTYEKCVRFKSRAGWDMQVLRRSLEEPDSPNGYTVASNYGVLTVCQALMRYHVNLPCDLARGGGPYFPFQRWTDQDLRRNTASEEKAGIPGQDWCRYGEEEVSSLTLLIWI